MLPPAKASDYYDLHPDPAHAPGDIWSDLPVHGLLSRARSSALVITPACDLANRKVDSITYLPILPVSEWCAQRPIEFEVRRNLSNALSSLSIVTSSRTGPPLPTPDTAGSAAARQRRHAVAPRWPRPTGPIGWRRPRSSAAGRWPRIRRSPLARREQPRRGGDLGGRGAQHAQDVLL